MKELLMKKILGFILALALLTPFAFLTVANAQTEGAGRPEIIKHRTNPNAATGDAVTKGSTGVITPQISYHGGALIGTPTIYYIWYGNWNQSNGSDNPAGQQILRDFAHTVGSSAYYNINTTYSTGGYVISGGVLFGGETTDTGSQGTRLRDSSIGSIVVSALNAGRLPYDPNGVYFVLTSSNVSESSGFCTKYCGWHTSGTISSGTFGGQRVRYSFIGNAQRCLSACAAQTISPNGNAGVDGMVSIIAHELEEAATDPDPLSGWADSGGAENADKCAWTFGQSLFTLSSGAVYNMTLGSGTPLMRNYLIQRNLKFAASGSTCNVSLTAQ
jgi:phosphate-induced protein 1